MVVAGSIVGVVAVAWPDRVVLGVLGGRADAAALVWAFALADRWTAEVHVVGGYRPPVGMFPHIVTEAEWRARRQAAHRGLAKAVTTTVDPDLLPVEPPLTVIPENQLEQALVEHSRTADLLLLSLAPTRIGWLDRRSRSRAQRLVDRARCPASMGPGSEGAGVGIESGVPRR